MTVFKNNSRTSCDYLRMKSIKSVICYKVIFIKNIITKFQMIVLKISHMNLYFSYIILIALSNIFIIERFLRRNIVKQVYLYSADVTFQMLIHVAR